MQRWPPFLPISCKLTSTSLSRSPKQNASKSRLRHLLSAHTLPILLFCHSSNHFPCPNHLNPSTLPQKLSFKFACPFPPPFSPCGFFLETPRDPNSLSCPVLSSPPCHNLTWSLLLHSQSLKTGLKIFALSFSNLESSTASLKLHTPLFTSLEAPPRFLQPPRNIRPPSILT